MKRREREKNPLEDADGVNIEWADKAERYIRDVYERAAPFRRVPPPENIAHELLRHIQENTCLMCRCGDLERMLDFRGERLVEDHDHETGMVRALLCRRCNTTEGSAGRRPWMIYRQFAPANGWYYRYDGWGAQWQGGDPDPLSGRMKLPASAGMARYLETVSALPPTDIPLICRRRFDFGKPVLLPGERWATNEELRPRGVGSWPIRGHASGSQEDCDRLIEKQKSEMLARQRAAFDARESGK